MARPGITFNDVSTAAIHLISSGKHPTIEQIRLLLGSGSSTTIANHLKQWKEQQQGNSLLATKENIPEELTEVVKGLWERVISLSQEKITSVETSLQHSNTSLHQELDKYKTNNRRWQHLFTQWHQESAKLRTERQDLELKIEVLQRNNASFQAKLEAQLEQLQEKQATIAELRLLNTQAQANLEYYRDAVREQRREEQQELARQKERNDQLEQEKWLLAEEKARLEGQIKQMHKMQLA